MDEATVTIIKTSKHMVKKNKLDSFKKNNIGALEALYKANIDSITLEQVSSIYCDLVKDVEISSKTEILIEE